MSTKVIKNLQDYVTQGMHPEALQENPQYKDILELGMVLAVEHIIQTYKLSKSTENSIRSDFDYNP